MDEASAHAVPTEGEWRCHHCAKLLGHLRDGRLHLRPVRGHSYLVGLPATTVCRGCQTLNELASATSATARLCTEPQDS